jgi:hypothetical protein
MAFESKAARRLRSNSTGTSFSTSIDLLQARMNEYFEPGYIQI